MTNHQPTILAVNPGSRYLGFAILSGQELYLDANKAKLMDTLAQYKKLGSDEDILLEEIELLTEELELMDS